jgi:oligopeptide/dipeptide ABC transporter ATP-binding protein
MTDGPRYHERGLLRGLEILCVFSTAAPSLSLTELQDRLGIPKSSLVRLLSCLEYMGFVEQDPTTKAYRLGIRALQLGSTYRAVLRIEDVAQPFLEELAQILNLFVDLQQKFGLTYLFISHDLSVIKHIADRVAVMYLGHLVEMAPKHAIYGKPLHPYTQALLAAVPSFEYGRLRRNVVIAPGEIPSPLTPPPGCPYSTRCSRATVECRRQMPPLAAHGGQRLVACYHPLDSEVSAAS